MGRRNTGELKMKGIISAVFRFPQRDKVMERLAKVPIPYLLSATKDKILDVEFWRLVAKANMTLDDKYVKALFAYGIINLNSKTRLAKNKTKEPFTLPMFRQNDRHLEFIIRNSREVANELRVLAPEMLPVGMNKGIEPVK